jgi:hypothetical protein
MPFGAPPVGLQQRLPNWEDRLRDLVNRTCNEPYRYGLFDCWTFASMGVLAVTGVTLLPGVVLPRGWLGAAKFLLKHNLDNVEELAIAALGILPDDPERARAGDLVLHIVGEEQHLALRVGNAAVTPASDGLVVVERSRWTASWAIGWDPSDTSAAPEFVFADSTEARVS